LESGHSARTSVVGTDRPIIATLNQASRAMFSGEVARLAPLDASAAKPVIEDRFSETTEEVIPICEEGPVTLSEHVKGVEKAFFDKDGNLSKATFQINETTTLTSAFGETFDRWAWAGTYDPKTDSYTERGNQWNVHAGAGGILVNDSGLIQFTFVEGEFTLLRAAGPRDAYPDGPGDPCGILFPS